MPQVQETIAQLEDQIGVPIVILTAWDRTTKTYMVLTVRDLGVLAVAQVVAWLNARLSTP
jgi:hypothetical protein